MSSSFLSSISVQETAHEGNEGVPQNKWNDRVIGFRVWIGFRQNINKPVFGRAQSKAGLCIKGSTSGEESPYNPHAWAEVGWQSCPSWLLMRFLCVFHRGTLSVPVWAYVISIIVSERFLLRRGRLGQDLHVKQEVMDIWAEGILGPRKESARGLWLSWDWGGEQKGRAVADICGRGSLLFLLVRKWPPGTCLWKLNIKRIISKGAEEKRHIIYQDNILNCHGLFF